MSFFVRKLGIDLGTANTLVFVPGKGVVLFEPSVVAISEQDNKILAVGLEAKNMIGKTPGSIIAYRPMKDGVIADYRVTEAMLRYFINKVMGKIRVVRPEIMISIPAGVTSTERRAVIDAAVKAGAKSAYVVKEPLLAAIGAGADDGQFGLAGSILKKFDDRGKRSLVRDIDCQHTCHTQHDTKTAECKTQEAHTDRTEGEQARKTEHA